MYPDPEVVCGTRGKGQLFGGVLGSILLPSQLVIVAQHWTSALVVAASLKLPISAAYVNPKFIPILSSLPLPPSLALQSTDLFIDSILPHPATVIGSGALEFFVKIKHRLAQIQSFVWVFEQHFRDDSHSSVTRFFFLRMLYLLRC